MSEKHKSKPYTAKDVQEWFAKILEDSNDKCPDLILTDKQKEFFYLALQAEKVRNES